MDRDEPPFNSKGSSGGPFSSGGTSGGGETGLSRLRRERERVDAQRAASKEAKADPYAGQTSQGSADPGGRSRSFERTGRFSRENDAGQGDTGGRSVSAPSITRDRFSQTGSSPSTFQQSATGNDPARVSMRERKVPIETSSENAGDPVRTRPSYSTRQDAPAPDGRSSGFSARGDGAPASARIERTRPGSREPSWRVEQNDTHSGSDGRSAEPESVMPSGPADTRAPVENSRLGQNFRSRFSKPPKAYDLDEIGDKGLPLDLLEEGENANFEPSNEIANHSDAGVPAPRGEAKPAEVIRRRSRVDFSSRGTRAREETQPQRVDDFPAAVGPDDYGQQAPSLRQNSPDDYAPPPAPMPAPVPQTEYYIEDDAAASAPSTVNYADDEQDFGPVPRETYQAHEATDAPVGQYDQYQDYGDDQSQPGMTPHGQEPHQEFYSDPYDPAPDDQLAGPPAQAEDDPFGDLDDFEPLPNYDDPIDPQEAELTQGDRNGFPAVAPEPYIDEEYGDPEPAVDSFSDLRADVDASDRGAKPDYSGTFNDFEAKGSSKKPLLLVASLAGVAVIAGGLIFAYQMFSDGGDGRIPIVKLDEAATRVAPDEPGGEEIPHQNKLIYDRIVGEKSTVDEQIVSREEGVIDLNSGNAGSDQGQTGSDATTSLEIPPAPISPDDTDVNTSIDNGRDDAIALLQPTSDNSASSVGTPIVPTPTAPDDTTATDEPAPEPTSPVPDLRVETVSPPDPEPVRDTTRPSPPVPRNKPPAPKRVTRVATNNSSSSSTGPINLTPTPRTADTPSAAPSTAVQSVNVSEPAQIATAPAPAPTPSLPAVATGTGDYLIQIAAFRSEAEAIAEYQRLRGRHSGLLAGYEPIIQKADLQARGIYYRLRLGPIDGKGRARGLCDSLLAAGETDCLVRSR